MRSAAARIPLAVVAVVAAGWVAIGAVRTWAASEAVTTLGQRPYSEATKAAVDLRLDEGRSIFQLTLLITAALWGLVIAKKSSSRWRVPPAARR